MQTEKVVIDAVKFWQLFNWALEATHHKPFNIVSNFLQDVKDSAQPVKNENKES